MKTRHSRYGKFGDNEIIEIKEPSNYKVKVYQRKKDPTENTSSEATTPNKRKIKKKKIDNETVEILEVKDTGKKKRANSKVVKREIKKNKSEDKVRKNNVIIKKEKKIRSINLNESDNEIEEIKITSKDSRPSKKKEKQLKTKSYPKTPDKVVKKKNQNNNQIKNKKKTKVKPLVNKNKEMQYELSSSEGSDIEITQDKSNVGFFSSRKASQAKKKVEQDQRSRSTIKASKENISLLGKKRKNERNIKSRTPDKINKSQVRVVNKVPIEIKSSPIKMRAGKSSRTPVKNYSKKNKNIIPIDSGSNSSNNKNYVTPELAVLNQLIVEFGFEKVLDSLCKAKLNHKNKLDSCVQGLRDSCANEKLPLFLIKMLFSYFNNKEKDKKEKIEEENIPEKEKENEKEKEKEKDNKKSLSILKSSSTENTNTNNELIDPSEKPISKSPTKISTSVINNKIDSIITPILLNEQITPPIQLKDDTPKKVAKILQEKKKEDKSPIKARNDEVKKEKKNMSIGSHYHKDEDGLIYKYQVSKLDGQGNAIFKCYDDKCLSEGMYELDSRKFTVTVKHSLKHQEHDYVMNYDKVEDNVFKEMTNLNKKDAQVFKEGNERSVKLY